MGTKTGKTKLFREAVKDQHTSHWDLDMLTWEELETMLGDADAGKETEAGADPAAGTGQTAEKNGKSAGR